MSKLVVDIEQKNKKEIDVSRPDDSSGKVSRSKGRLVLKIAAAFSCLAVFALLAGSVSGYFYWQSLKATPQYSLALIVDAARNDRDDEIAKLVDTDSVVDRFVPQVTEKAIDLYGRGLPPELLKKVESVAAPVMPVVKQRAKAELPELLREKTSRFEYIPFWTMVIGAERYLDIEYSKGEAIIRSKIKDRPLELTMQRVGDRWKIVEVRDEKLARRIAEKIGQEIIVLAKQAGSKQIEDVGKQLGIDDINDLLKKAEEIFSN